MTLLTLLEDGQVVLPVELRASLAVKVGDLLEASVSNGEIHLRPAARQEAEPVGPGVDISPWVGAGTGIFGTLEEIDEYIRKERDSWD